MYEVDYLGIMSLAEILMHDNGFNDFQREKIKSLQIGQTIELIDANMTFNVKRIS